MTIISEEELARRRREKAKNKKRQQHQWEVDAAVSLDDFHSYMPMHKYFYKPTGDLWPAASVNSRVPPVLMNPGSNPEDQVLVLASQWLDRNRPVEQMTWMPGEPTIIENRIVAEGGFIERQGSRIFNLYRAPMIERGDPEKASPWLEHVRTVYGDDADHILKWLAHRVQRPGEKINHALLLGGAPGIGKDTILHPVSYAIGSWNFEEVNPTQLLGRFNGFIKSVILRINEARDLGDISSYAFYEHLKPITAAPPETLRIDEKGLREYRVPNVVGVVITSNYKTDGCYLPADDRRHYVAWSDLPPAGENGALPADYFDKLYRWYEDGGGNRHVAAWLRQHDLSGFDPKAPPPKTHAFWEIVDAHHGSNESEFADTIDRMTEHGGGRKPVVFSTDNLIDNASAVLAAWIRDPKNRRQVPKRLEKVGYVRVQNPDADDHLWKIGGRRQAVYGARSVSEQTRINEARQMCERNR
ncbi:hypothetical protein IE4803_CH03787 [Rhizobium etli bv. phaseoli str. IE4803]|nr:hypothetical protein IE4803_CH03787 [Rhizobium etli bv. phaseoli str. IE4803]